jgi:hypothetical protein
MKRAAIILVTIIVGLAILIMGAFFGLRYLMRPPSEAKLLENFYAHRATFEQLQEDKQISRLAEWGVHLQGDEISKPPEGNFPVERFQRYLTLLKEARAIAVSRDDDPHPYLNIFVWGSGFAGNTVHIAICWTDDKVPRQVSTFDEYYRTRKAPAGSGWVFRHIDSNWYLCTDLWSR